MALMTGSLIRFFSMLLLVSMVGGCTSTAKTNQVSVSRDEQLQNRLQLAVNYMRSGNHERAREHLARAEEIDSRSPEVHDLYALLYQREREFDIAEKHYKKALGYDPGFTRGRNNYGSFLLRQGRAEEACEQFKKGAEDLSYVRRFELFYKIGLCATRTGDNRAAIEALLKSLALNQQFSPASLELASISFSEKEYAKAKQYLNHYNSHRYRPTPRGLWLGVQLEHMFGNKDARDSQGLALKNLFPDSEENLRYQNWLKNGYKE